MRLKLLVSVQRPPQCPPTLIKHHGYSMISPAGSRNITGIFSSSELTAYGLLNMKVGCEFRQRFNGLALLIRPRHADALVSDPRPLLHQRGLGNSPDASMDAFTVCRGARSAGDFPLTGLVGEAVSDLEVPREDVVGQKSDLSP